MTTRIEASGRPVADLTLGEGIKAMLAFYADERADGCKLDEDGDMLLYQWGTYGVESAGKTFQFDVTRQFVLPRQDEPFQLSFTFHFPATAKLAKLRSGSRWCPSPGEVGKFRKAMLASPAYRAVGKERALKVELDFGQC